MKRLGKFALLSVLALVGFAARAERKIGFQTDAFNRVYPASYAKNFVFSPAAFEIDCAVVAESLDVIPKANVSESMGIVIDFPSTFCPVVDALSSDTNGLSVISARGYCVRSPYGSSPSFRLKLEDLYGVEVMRFNPPDGAENWFHSAMEGTMDDFKLPKAEPKETRYSYYDLETISIAWREVFPEEGIREYVFHSPSKPKVKCLTDIRQADTRETEAFTVLRLPLKGEAWFYAVMPKKGHELAEIRQALTSDEIDEFLAVMDSETDLSVEHGPCAIALPMFTLDRRIDFASALSYFGIPTKGLVNVDGEASPREIVQRTRFTLGNAGEASAKKPSVPAEGVNVKKVLLTRPFVFFVHHKPTRTIPVAGQYCAEE